MAVKIISIEGNIGSGKSTLFENLRTYYKDNKQVIFLMEPVRDWESIKDDDGIAMLQKFYADQHKYSFSFQMMAYISRLAILKQAVEDHPDAIIITERCLHTDKYVFAKMLYDSGKIESVNYQIYLKWFDTFAKDFPIHKIIYMKADPQICMDRIHKRARTGESVIPLEYLEACHKYHNDMMAMDNICHDQLVMNSNIDIHANPSQVTHWINEIDQFIMTQPN